MSTLVDLLFQIQSDLVNPDCSGVSRVLSGLGFPFKRNPQFPHQNVKDTICPD